MLEHTSAKLGVSNPWNNSILEAKSFPNFRKAYPDVDFKETLLETCKRTNPKEVAEWVSAIKGLSARVESYQPDCIYIAMRGASPFANLLTKFLPKLLDKIPVVPLPIGTVAYLKDTTPVSLGFFGFNNHVKIRLIESAVKNSGVRSNKPMLIDEVQAGSTATSASINLLKALAVENGEKVPLELIALEDASQSEDRLHNLYRRLRLGDIPDINVTPYKAKLITVDSLRYLDSLFLSSSEGHPLVGTPDIGNINIADVVCIENLVARSVISSLYDIFVGSSDKDFDVTSVIGKDPFPEVVKNWMSGFIRESSSRTL